MLMGESDTCLAGGEGLWLFSAREKTNAQKEERYYEAQEPKTKDDSEPAGKRKLDRKHKGVV